MHERRLVIPIVNDGGINQRVQAVPNNQFQLLGFDDGASKVPVMAQTAVFGVRKVMWHKGRSLR